MKAMDKKMNHTGAKRPGEKRGQIPKSWIVAFAIAGILLLSAQCGGLYAKYMQSQERTATVLARDFYFTSDYLRDTEEPMKRYTLNAPVSPPNTSNTTSVTITLNNFADALRASEMDTCYTVSVKDARDPTGGDLTTVQVKDAQGGVLAGNSGTIPAGGTAEVTIEGLAAGEKYLVTVTGEGGKDGSQRGYLETLQATFEVAPKDTAVYMHVDDSDPENNYVILTVWTKNVIGNAVISIPENLIPDNTDPVMATAQTGSGTFTDAVSFQNAYASHSYRFFKAAGAGDYNTGSFEPVKVGSVAAAAGTP